MNSPIRSTVSNRTGRDLTLNLSGDRTVWVKAHGTATVDFDLWSLGDDSQHKSYVDMLSRGLISVSVAVHGKDGFNETEVVLEGRPARICTAPAVKDAAPVTGRPDHTIRAAGADTDVFRQAYGVTGKDSTMPPMPAERPADEREGFTRTKVQAEPAAEETPAEEPVAETPAEEPVEETPAEEPKAEPAEAVQAEEPAPAAEAADGDIAAAFDLACSEKRWQDALDMLKAKFGDRITFGTRAIMTAKTYAAVVEKYELA